MAMSRRIINAELQPLAIERASSAESVADMQNDFGAGMFARAWIGLSDTQSAIVRMARVLAAARKAASDRGANHSRKNRE
jgi:hypothetical protein